MDGWMDGWMFEWEFQYIADCMDICLCKQQSMFIEA
jgi:hypothetical protein